MPVFATRDQLRRWGAELAAGQRGSVIKAAQERSSSNSTFLSHSSKDIDFVAGAILILSNHGASVYIDKKDEKLPPYTNRETARILRSHIRDCRKFVLLASINAKDSKWIPWELGLADGYKNTSNTAIFPASDVETEIKWAEQEYLGVYDRIVWGKLADFDESVWMVWNQEKNEATELSSWLAN